MIELLFKNNAIPAAVLDSLKKVNIAVVHNIDSLKKEVDILNVKAALYDRGLYLQITAFVLIVTIVATLAAIISWSAITRSLNAKIDSMQNDNIAAVKDQNKIFDGFKTDIKKELKSTKEDIEEVSYNVKRAMYLNTVSTGQYDSAMVWILNALPYSYIHRNHGFKKILDEVECNCKYITCDMLKDEEGYQHLQKAIVRLLDIVKEEDHKNTINKIYHTINTIKYQKTDQSPLV